MLLAFHSNMYGASTSHTEYPIWYVVLYHEIVGGVPPSMLLSILCATVHLLLVLTSFGDSPANKANASGEYSYLWGERHTGMNGGASVFCFDHDASARWQSRFARPSGSMLCTCLYRYDATTVIPPTCTSYRTQLCMRRHKSVCDRHSRQQCCWLLT